MKNLIDIAHIDYDGFIGREFGSVTILKMLGRGNRGIVFIGFQKTLRRQVAVKILPKIFVTGKDDKDQFRDEAEIVAGLSHPNIVPIFEMGEEEEFYYLSMQLVKGDDLNTIIKNHLRHPVSSKRILPQKESIGMMLHILDGLAFAHDEGVVHQDIKPANILIEERTKRPLIADFGIAKALQYKEKSPIDVVMGSPVYLSPEQANAQETDFRTDIYSAGVLMYKLLVGELPRRRERVVEIVLRKINEPETFFTKTPSETSKAINKDLELIILKSVEPDKEKRYQDCYAFKDELQWYFDKYLD